MRIDRIRESPRAAELKRLLPVQVLDEPYAWAGLSPSTVNLLIRTNLLTQRQ
jgi:hypothetical protein